MLVLFITNKEVEIIFEYLDDAKDNTLSVKTIFKELYGIDIEQQKINLLIKKNIYIYIFVFVFQKSRKLPWQK